MLEGGLPNDVRLSDRSHLLVADGELLLGEHQPVLLQLERLPARSGSKTSVPVSWLEVWRGNTGLNWRDHVGRVVRFQASEGRLLTVGIGHRR